MTSTDPRLPFEMGLDDLLTQMTPPGKVARPRSMTRSACANFSPTARGACPGSR
jgi:hypothetical protein